MYGNPGRSWIAAPQQLAAGAPGTSPAGFAVQQPRVLRRDVQVTYDGVDELSQARAEGGIILEADPVSRLEPPMIDGPGTSRRATGITCLFRLRAKSSSLRHIRESTESGEMTKMNLPLRRMAASSSGQNGRPGEWRGPARPGRCPGLRPTAP